MTTKNEQNRMRRYVPFAAVLLPWIVLTTANAQTPPADQGDKTAKDQAVERFVIEMKPCEAERPGRLRSGMGITDLLKGIPKDVLAWKGDFAVDGRTFTFYLPKADEYPIKNTGRDNTDFENTSTLISIDVNGDGKLTTDEGWYTNLPVRVGDAMFKITAIAADGSRIELRRSKAALGGAVVGWKCPPFAFKTPDGRKITLDDYKSKAFLIDIWSVT